MRAGVTAVVETAPFVGGDGCGRQAGQMEMRPMGTALTLTEKAESEAGRVPRSLLSSWRRLSEEEQVEIGTAPWERGKVTALLEATRRA